MLEKLIIKCPHCGQVRNTLPDNAALSLFALELPLSERLVLDALMLRWPAFATPRHLLDHLAAEGKSTGKDSLYVYLYRLRQTLSAVGWTIRQSRGEGYLLAKQEGAKP